MRDDLLGEEADGTPTPAHETLQVEETHDLRPLVEPCITQLAGVVKQEAPA